MVEVICTVRSYGRDRRHIEISKPYYDDLCLGASVVVMDKDTYDKLKSE